MVFCNAVLEQEQVMTDLIKRLRKAFNTFPIIEDSPVDLFQEAADRLEAAEARDVVTHEYLQSWIDRANEAEQTIKEISELPRHIGTNSLGQVFSFIDPYELEAALNRSKS
ncbi:MAG: hypothetical protein DRQ39_03545 [Gammaproteobacteria bacterium]|nr:MAG: hypothetical protein DRQ39_03545 [Gammaproteobacteria bacterium]